MEKQFSNLIPEHTIDQEFIDFLYERFRDVRSLSEKEFMEYSLNITSDLYPNFLK